MASTGSSMNLSSIRLNNAPHQSLPLHKGGFSHAVNLFAVIAREPSDRGNPHLPDFAKFPANMGLFRGRIATPVRAPVRNDRVLANLKSPNRAGWGIISFLSCRFYIHIRRNLSFNFSMGSFELFDIVSDQNQNMAVDTSTLVIRNIANLLKHFFFNSD